MQHMQDSIHIEAPVDQVWAFFFDRSHWPDWQPRGEYSDFSGELDQVGTTYVGSMKILGHEFKSTYKVLEVIPHRLYHEWGEMGPEETYVRFEPEDGGTRLSFESDYEMPRHLPKVIQDLLNKRWMERQTRQMLEDFKAIIETMAPVAV